MSVSYITVDQVIERLRSSYNNSDNTILADLITSGSAFLDTYCNRASGGFNVTQYDDLIDGTGSKLLYVDNYPIVSIQRIATTELPAFSVHNTDPDMGARALFNITSTGLTLTYIKNAVTITNTFTWVAYPTITQLVAAINGAGNNWTAIVMGGFGNWSSSDLRATQGAFGSRITTAYAWIHWMDLSWYRIKEASGRIYSPQGFCRGVYNWRITYTAGYSTFPADLAQALAELVAGMYYAKEINNNTTSESIGGYSYSQMAKDTFDGMSLVAKKTIDRYKLRTVRKFSTW